MITKEIEHALNDQINHELQSAYLYLSMSAYCEKINMPGSARWLRAQWQEETEHAMRLFDYMVDRGANVDLKAIDQPPKEFGTPVELFEQVLKHEKNVTQLIYGLYRLAAESGSYGTQIQLQWFVTEQIEEEKNAGQIVQQLRQIKDSSTGLLFLDRELGKRGAKAGD